MSCAPVAVVVHKEGRENRQRLDVEPQNGFDFCEILLRDAPVAAESRVVHPRLDLIGAQLVIEPVRVLRHGQIRRPDHDVHIGMRRRDLFAQPGELCLTPRGDDQVLAALSERLCRRVSDAGTRARDDGIFFIAHLKNLLCFIFIIYLGVCFMSSFFMHRCRQLHGRAVRTSAAPCGRVRRSPPSRAPRAPRRCPR